MIVKAGTGGLGIERGFDTLNGKGAYHKTRMDVLNGLVMGTAFKKVTPEERVQKAADILHKHGGDKTYARDILRHSTEGNTLAYAMTEHIAAHHFRKAGYDAVISHSKHQGKPRLSEVFDVNEKEYPR